jgi:hypothetical protein
MRKILPAAEYFYFGFRGKKHPNVTSAAVTRLE